MLRKTTDQFGEGSFSGSGRRGFSAGSGRRRTELESDESGAARIAYEYGSSSFGCASASFAHDCGGRKRGAGGHFGPNSSIAYDAREHRFVNGAVATQSASGR